MADIASMLARIASKIDDEGGRFSLSAEPPSGPPEGRWMALLEFGDPPQGSSLLNAVTAHASGDTVEQALAQIVQEAGL